MTYLDEYYGFAGEHDWDKFIKECENYDGICPSDAGLDGCVCDQTCYDCWHREIRKDGV